MTSRRLKLAREPGELWAAAGGHRDGRDRRDRRDRRVRREARESSGEDDEGDGLRARVAARVRVMALLPSGEAGRRARLVLRF
jgi:hypothetical protein